LYFLLLWTWFCVNTNWKLFCRKSAEWGWKKWRYKKQ
jgi:hypothetical protein